ncbi:DUF1322 family protein [Borrelia hispanica]|uniref:DUF1322 family protein n=1 Tax=Borrelia hispanica TaxID=40835 RepID=UPI000464AB1C|nr:DUF1322 family protein [Borrelia hispanica]
MKQQEYEDFIKIFNDRKNKYAKLINDIQQNKYFFPVIMGICSLNEVKNLNYEQLMEVNAISELKLEKQVLELTLGKSTL